jgi:mono/diheme cytochrome c family protein
MPTAVLLPALALIGTLILGAPLETPSTKKPVEESGEQEATFAKVARPFIERNCLGCHGPDTAKAGFRIDLLDADFSAASMAEKWKEVVDRVGAGEMPPDDRPQPDAKAAAAFVNWINARLSDVQRAANSAGGRIPMRRLNRDEYANTVRDLLKLDEQIVRPLIEELPADGQAEGFDRLGAALFFDQTQIERSLSVADTIAAVAIVTEAPKVNRYVNRFEFLRRRPPADMVEVFPAFTHTIPRGARDRIVHDEYIEHIQGYPTYRREYDGWGAIDHFSIRDVVTRDGYYRVRIHAHVDNRGRTEKNKFILQYGMDSPIQVEEQVELDPSGVTEAVLFLRGPVNGEVKGPQVFRLLWNHTHNSVIREPKYMALVSRWTQLRSQMERAATNRVPQAELDALKKKRDGLEAEMNAWTGVANIYNPEMDVEKLPRLLIEAIEVEGPIQKEWPPASHKALLFDGDDRQDEAYVREIFARFLPRAYRRPVTDAEIEAVVAVVVDAQSSGKLSFHEAMRIGLQRVLCAPGFQFLEEPAGNSPGGRPLTDCELASRLSYFLWSTMPDDELFELAAAGKLQDPAVIAAQVKRMLADPKAEQLVRNFAGQWLKVREYGTIEPAAEYRNYDRPLAEASKEEPFAFFAEVLFNDLPITSFLDSDFLVINERLARHYGIEGVTGPEFRRVTIRPEHHRGGVLGMAGLMTLLADGTRTLPMRRGSWVLSELLGDPPNSPPPNAGEIQPNTAGENLTVRQRLERHRTDAVCASCHAKLDPFGLALENYDAIGEWRERFNGEGFRGRDAPVLDVSGAFPDGRKFETLAEYKAGVLDRKDRFARAFSSKMLTYALGRPIGYADHELVDSLTETLKVNDYRIQSLIRAIALSTPFRSK